MTRDIRAVLVLLGLMVLSLFVGTRPMPVADTWQALTGFDPARGDHLLVWQLRVPRVLLGAVVGAAMGLAAVLMQALTRNPLADPGILGINGGAALAVVVVLAFGFIGMGAHVVAALAGAALAGAVVSALGRLTGRDDPTPLVLAGAAMSVVLAGIAQSVILNSDQAVLDRFRFWAVGSLQGRGMELTLLLALVATLAGAAALLLAPTLDALSLGKETGRALGADGRVGWLALAVLIVVLAGATTAVTGPIGFAGLVAAHVARGLSGPIHRRLLPQAMIVGAALVVGADMLGRVIARPGEVEAGIMCALIGAPFFLWLVHSRRMARL
ncbi:MAG: iron ABC transporter permease [Paracoccus sp. (in: a-proteobacteria)]|nr:iron ABC transporter permease [Paracoccus sp. (in: a-proteobacteria)]